MKINSLSSSRIKDIDKSRTLKNIIPYKEDVMYNTKGFQTCNKPFKVFLTYSRLDPKRRYDGI